MYGGTFEPAYVLDMTAIEQHCQTATNKRNAALLQSFLSDVLSVPLQRGLLRFQPIPEHCLAIGGRTIAADIEKAETDNGVKPSRRKSTASVKRKSTITTPAEKKEEKPVKERKSLMFIGRKNPEEKISDETPDVPNRRMTLGAQTSGETLRPSTADAANKENFYAANKSLTSTSPANLTTPNLSKPVLNPARQTNSHQRGPFSPPKAVPQQPRTFLNHSRPSSASRQSTSSMAKTTTMQGASTHKTSVDPYKLETSIPVSLTPPPIPQNTTPTPKMSKRKSLVQLFRRDTSAKASS
jgi:hypothetical protein